MIVTFVEYTIRETDYLLRCSIDAPGAGQSTDANIVVTDAEMATVTTAAQFRTLIQPKIDRATAQLRNTGVAAKLNNVIGQSITL